MYMKTKDLAKEFGYCRKEMLVIIKQMIEAGYNKSIICPVSKNGTYRAEVKAVESYLLERGTTK